MRWRSKTGATSFLCGTLLLGPLLGIARADAVPPPPEECPRGTHGTTGHSGAGCVSDHCPAGSLGMMCKGAPTCKVIECVGDGGGLCGGKCQQVKACVRPTTCGGGWQRPTPAFDAVASCSGGEPCPADSTCKTFMACVGLEDSFSKPPTPPKAPDKAKPTSDNAGPPPGSQGPGLVERKGCFCAVAHGSREIFPGIPGVLMLVACMVRRRNRSRLGTRPRG